MCWFKLLEVTKDNLEQYEQLKGLSPVCCNLRSCPKFPLKEKDLCLWQCGQLNGFSPLWNLTWAFSWIDCVKAFVQWVQLKGCSPLFALKWVFKFTGNRKAFSHWAHKGVFASFFCSHEAAKIGKILRSMNTYVALSRQCVLLYEHSVNISDRNIL